MSIQLNPFGSWINIPKKGYDSPEEITKKRKFLPDTCLPLFDKFLSRDIENHVFGFISYLSLLPSNLTDYIEARLNPCRAEGCNRYAEWDCEDCEDYTCDEHGCSCNDCPICHEQFDGSYVECERCEAHVCDNCYKDSWDGREYCLSCYKKFDGRICSRCDAPTHCHKCYVCKNFTCSVCCKNIYVGSSETRPYCHACGITELKELGEIGSDNDDE